MFLNDSGIKKFLEIGVYYGFSTDFFCLTVPKKFVQATFWCLRFFAPVLVIDCPRML